MARACRADEHQARIPGYAAAPRPSSQTRFQLVNVAHWESRKALQAATADTEFQERIRAVTADTQVPISANPALYQIAVEFGGLAPDERRRTSPPANHDPS